MNVFKLLRTFLGQQNSTTSTSTSKKYFQIDLEIKQQYEIHVPNEAIRNYGPASDITGYIMG